jgi:membrane-associated phospholipid phosphatase
LLTGAGVAALLANTTADGRIQNWYQNEVRYSETDNLAKYVKPFGNGRFTLPVYAGAALLGIVPLESGTVKTVSKWGQMSLRAILVGAPPMLTLQKALGASRPYENTSDWRFFKDNNAVSGHAFMGAIPFMTAARLAENNFIRYSFYLCSSLTALSRINDHKHYFSQSLLGWWIALLSVSSLSENSENRCNRISVYPTSDGFAFHFYF